MKRRFSSGRRVMAGLLCSLLPITTTWSQTPPPRAASVIPPALTVNLSSWAANSPAIAEIQRSGTGSLLPAFDADLPAVERSTRPLAAHAVLGSFWNFDTGVKPRITLRLRNTAIPSSLSPELLRRAHEKFIATYGRPLGADESLTIEVFDDAERSREHVVQARDLPPVRIPRDKPGGAVDLWAQALAESEGLELIVCEDGYCLLTPDDHEYTLPPADPLLIGEVWHSVYTLHERDLFLSIDPTPAFLSDTRRREQMEDRLELDTFSEGFLVRVTPELWGTRLEQVLFEADVAFKSYALERDVLAGQADTSDRAWFQLPSNPQDLPALVAREGTRLLSEEPRRDRWCRYWWTNGVLKPTLDDDSRTVRFSGSAIVAHAEPMALVQGQLVRKPGPGCVDAVEMTEALNHALMETPDGVGVLTPLVRVSQWMSLAQSAAEGLISVSAAAERSLALNAIRSDLTPRRVRAPLYVSGAAHAFRPRLPASIAAALHRAEDGCLTLNLWYPDEQTAREKQAKLADSFRRRCIELDGQPVGTGELPQCSVDGPNPNFDALAHVREHLRGDDVEWLQGEAFCDPDDPAAFSRCSGRADDRICLVESLLPVSIHGGVDLASDPSSSTRPPWNASRYLVDMRPLANDTLAVRLMWRPDDVSPDVLPDVLPVEQIRVPSAAKPTSSRSVVVGGRVSSVAWSKKKEAWRDRRLYPSTHDDLAGESRVRLDVDRVPNGHSLLRFADTPVPHLDEGESARRRLDRAFETELEHPLRHASFDTGTDVIHVIHATARHSKESAASKALRVALSGRPFGQAAFDALSGARDEGFAELVSHHLERLDPWSIDRSFLTPLIEMQQWAAMSIGRFDLACRPPLRRARETSDDPVEGDSALNSALACLAEGNAGGWTPTRGQLAPPLERLLVWLFRSDDPGVTRTPTRRGVRKQLREMTPWQRVTLRHAALRHHRQIQLDAVTGTDLAVQMLAEYYQYRDTSGEGPL